MQKVGIEFQLIRKADSKEESNYLAWVLKYQVEGMYLLNFDGKDALN